MVPLLILSGKKAGHLASQAAAGRQQTSHDPINQSFQSLLRFRITLGDSGQRFCFIETISFARSPLGEHSCLGWCRHCSARLHLIRQGRPQQLVAESKFSNVRCYSLGCLQQLCVVLSRCLTWLSNLLQSGHHLHRSN